MNSPKTHFAKRIAIRDKVIAEHEPPYIIAEMALAHEGELDFARHLIDVAVEAEADAVQLEMVHLSDNLVPTAKLYDVVENLCFSPEEFAGLFEYTRQYDIALSAFAYDLPSLKLALELGADMVKLNSSDLLHYEMLQVLGEADIPFTLGTGSSTVMEIASALEMVLEAGGNQVVLMHGVQNFPTDMRNAHVRRMALLRETFDALVGYADHTEGDHELSGVIDLVAVGMGACVIEKHITHDRSKKGIDHQSALNPDEFKQFVHTIRQGGMALGVPRYQTLSKSDRKYRQFQKKALLAAVDIPAGTALQREHVTFLRVDASYPELSPMDFLSLEGKQINQPIQQYEPISRRHFDG